MLKINKLFDYLICIENKLFKELKNRNILIQKLDSEILTTIFELENEELIASKLDHYSYLINNLLKDTNIKIRTLIKTKIKIKSEIARLSFKHNKKNFLLQKSNFIQCFEPIFNKYPFLLAFQIENRPCDPESFYPYNIKWYFNESDENKDIVKEEVCNILRSFTYDSYYNNIIKNNLFVTKGKLYKNYENYFKSMQLS